MRTDIPKRKNKRISNNNDNEKVILFIDSMPKEVKYNEPKCWEIYFAYLPPAGEGDHCLSGVHPFLIDSNDVCNKTSTEINGYAITSKKTKIPVQVAIYPDKDNGLYLKSTILIEQHRTIPKRYLISRMGIIKNEKLREKIRRAVMMQSGILNAV